MVNSVQELINNEVDPITKNVNIKNVVNSLIRNGVKVVKENNDFCEKRFVLYNQNIKNNNKLNSLSRECNGMVITNLGETLVYPIPPIVNFNHYDILENSTFNVTPLYDGTIINMYYYMNTWRLSTRRTYDCTKLYPDGVEMTYGGIVFGMFLTFNIDIAEFNTEYSYSLCVSSKVLHPYAKIDRISLIAIYNKSGDIIVENIKNLSYSPIKKYTYTEIKEFVKSHATNVDNKYFGSLITTDSINFLSNETTKIYKLESNLFYKIQQTLYNPNLVIDLRNMGVINRSIYTVVYNVLNSTIDNLIEIMPEWTKYYEILILVLMELSVYINKKVVEENNKTNNVLIIIKENEKHNLKKISSNYFINNLLNNEFVEKFREFGNGFIKNIYNIVEKNKKLPETIRIYINISSQLAYQLYELIFIIYNHINQNVTDNVTNTQDVSILQ
jgi:hypothetical protein